MNLEWSEGDVGAVGEVGSGGCSGEPEAVGGEPAVVVAGEGCSDEAGGEPGANIGLILGRCILIYGRTCCDVRLSPASVLPQR